MKIVFLMPQINSGGAERTLSYVSSYIADAGHEVVIVTLGGKVFYDINEKINLINLGINSSSIGLKEKLLNGIQRFTKTKKAIKDLKPDVVFCMLPATAKYVLGIKKKVGFPLITSERNNPLYDTEEIRKLKEKIYKKSDGIIFQTSRAMECFPEEIQKKGTVIENAVGNELAYTLKLPKKKENKFFAVGRLNKQKDYPMMFEAFSIFSQKYPGYNLEIYGSGEQEKNLKRLAQTMGLSDSIHFKGTSKTALKDASDSKCFLLSSIYEGMPNVLMEAMAVGMPCISTDCPFGPRELIKSGVNGLLTPVGDANAFAEAMCKMVVEESFAQMCGIDAKKILETNSIEVISQKYLDYILNVIKAYKERNNY